MTPRQQRLLDRVKVVLESRGASPPAPEDVASELHVPIMAVREMLREGVSNGQIVRVDEGMFYTAEHVSQLATKFGPDRELPRTVVGVKDELGCTRAHAMALLKYFSEE